MQLSNLSDTESARIDANVIKRCSEGEGKVRVAVVVVVTYTTKLKARAETCRIYLRRCYHRLSIDVHGRSTTVEGQDNVMPCLVAHRGR